MKDNIKGLILEVAAKRFAYYGYNKTTVEEIAKDVNIAKGSIYLHFGSKEDILLELVVLGQNRIIEDWLLIQNSKLPLEQKLYVLLKTRLTYIMDKKKSFFLFSVKPERLFQRIVQVDRQFRPKQLSILEAILLEGVEKGEFFIKDVPRIAVAFYESILNILYRTNFDEDFLYDPYFDNMFKLMVSK